jgi:nucleoid-associated protein YgaU
LGGTVANLALKALAEQLAAGVEGVGLVDSRGLAVAPPALIEPVTASLKADARTTCFNLAVTQQGAAVTLQGKVFSQQAIEVIELLVHRVAGVEGLDLSQLTIEPVMGEYIVKEYDNLETVAQSVYGSPANSRLIYAANPGKFPLQPGFVLAIPPLDLKIGGLPVLDCTNIVASQ